jgi:chain length determinant protein EpsF
MDAFDIPSYSTPSPGPSQLSPQYVITVLRARWRLAAYVFAGVVAAALLLTLIWPVKYDGLASVVVDASPDPVSNPTGQQVALEEYVTTQADVIASERVARRVVQMTKLDQDPDMIKAWQKKKHAEGDMDVWLADYVLKKLTVTQTNATAKNPGNVIDIAVRWPDPKMAALLANTFAQAAIDTDIELKVQQAKQYGDWFIKRSRELHAELEQKQKILSDFEKATGIVATDEKLDVENNRLAELSTALVNIQNERQDSQSRQQHAGTTDYDSLPEVLANPVIGALKNELSAAEARQSDVASQLGKNHPDYQAAVLTVKNLRERIAQESAKIANSLDTTAHVNVRRESELRAALDEQRKKVLELKHEHDQASILEGDVAAVQSSLDAVNQRLAQTNLESQTHQTNIVLLTSAPIPLEPASPKLMLNIAIGIFLGLLAGVGTAMWQEVKNPRIRQDKELAAILGVPILGKIGSISIRSTEGKKPSRRLLPNAGPSRI